MVLFIKMISCVLKLCSGVLSIKAATCVADIRDKGAMLQHCVGFMYCSHSEISRPGGHVNLQRACYRGHKWFHSLKFVTFSTPDGLMFAL